MQLEVEAVMVREIDELVCRPEWQLACRVAASKGLSKSERLPKFLLYICEQHLLGRTREITEQRIGIQIFNRSADYNPGEDNIVRSYARLLRKRLDNYFEGEGSGETMRIVVPRGGYVPIFERYSAFQEPLSSAPSSEDTQSGDLAAPAAIDRPEPEVALEANLLDEKDERVQTDRRSRRDLRPIWLASLIGLAVGLLIASAAWLGIYALRTQRALGPTHAMWAQLFQKERNTLIVPSDSGLGILQNISQHLVNIEEYANGSYLSALPLPPGIAAENFNDLARERYTSVVSLNITSQLIRLPEFISDRTQIRYARSISAEDIETSNVILLGSKHTNPWVSLFEKRLAFKLEYTPEVDESYVLNEHPVAAEQKIYRNSTGGASNSTYGTIAYLPGLDGATHVLILQGLNMAATQAAADMLFDARGIQPVLQQAKLPDGALRPFELLIATTSIGATAPTAQIIATRVY